MRTESIDCAKEIVSISISFTHFILLSLCYYTGIVMDLDDVFIVSALLMEDE
jgi:hypothetical protein